MNISPEDKNIAIEAILSKGLTKPMSTWELLREMRRTLGFRVIFWETGAAFIISCAVALACLAFISAIVTPLNSVWSVYPVLFSFSPVIFICLTLCTEAISRINGLHEIKMASKYSLRQVTAFRLLCFSLVGTVFTVVCSVTMSAMWEPLHFTRILSLSLCSLFLCSWLCVYVMRRVRGGWYKGAIIWAAACILPVLFWGEQWGSLLSNLPAYVTFGVTTIACLLFLREIKITIKGVFYYVDC